MLRARWVYGIAILFVLSISIDLSDHSESSMALQYVDLPLDRAKTLYTENFTQILPSDQLITANLTFQTRPHQWMVMNLTSDQIVYFSINTSDLQASSMVIEIHNPNNVSYTSQSLILEYELVEASGSNSEKLLGKFTPNAEGNWTLFVNSTQDKEGIYSISTYIPKNGFDYNTARTLDKNSTGEFKSEIESQFWSVSLEGNQRCSVKALESSQNILEGSILVVWEKAGRILNSIETEQEIVSPEDGNISTSWVAKESGLYYVEVKHNTAYPLGNYSFILEKRQIGYNFDTAFELEVNKTFLSSVTHSDRYFENTFFKFEVIFRGVDVQFQVTELDSEVLEAADVKIFDSGKNTAITIINENAVAEDGNITGSFFAEEAGTYYISVEPRSFQQGNYLVLVIYSEPHFTWSVAAIAISSLFLVVLPLGLIFIDNRRGKDQDPWIIELPKNTAFKILSRNPDLPRAHIVPYEAISFKLIMQNYAVMTLLSASDRENETLAFLSRKKRKWEVFHLLATSLLTYIVFNAISFLLTRTSILWFPLSTLFDLQVFILPVALLVIGYIVVTLIPQFYFRKVTRTIDRLVTDFNKENEHDEKVFASKKEQLLSVEQSQKNLAYIRVLWNQSKKAYREEKYTHFIIKADSAVKKLLETRFNQLVPANPEQRLEFWDITEALRERGFDIPSVKRMEQNRKIRNQVVHSSLSLGKQEAISLFDYYSTFLARLGLRT